MSSKIQFMKIKKIQRNYYQIAHLNRQKIIYNLKNLNVEKKIYRKNQKIYIDLSFEDTHKFNKIYNKLKSITIDTVYEKYKDKNISKDKISKNYSEKLIKNEDENILTFEIHPNCEFFCSNEYDDIKEDDYKNITKDCGVNIYVNFRGIIYGKSKYTNYFIIHKIVRNYEEENNLNECYISDDSDEDIDLNEEMYSNTNKKRFSDLFLEDQESISDIAKLTLQNIIDNITK